MVTIIVIITIVSTRRIKTFSASPRPMLQRTHFLADTREVPLSSKNLKHSLSQAHWQIYALRPIDIPNMGSPGDGCSLPRRKVLYNYLNFCNLWENISNCQKRIWNETKCIFQTKFCNPSLEFFLLPPHTRHPPSHGKTFSLTELSSCTEYTVRFPWHSDGFKAPSDAPFSLQSSSLAPRPAPGRNQLLPYLCSHKSGTALLSCMISSGLWPRLPPAPSRARVCPVPAPGLESGTHT